MRLVGLAMAVVFFGAAPPIQHFDCNRATGPITVDGRLDEPAWKAIPPITSFRELKSFAAPAEKTEFRIAYDDAYLYFSFRCDDADVFTLYEERDANLWESDVVELFLQPVSDNPIYYEFEIAPNNAVYDARMVNSGSGGFRRWAKWNCDIKTAARVDGTLNDWRDRDSGYTVEAAIPLAAFREAIGDKPLKGQTWKIAAARMNFSVTLEAEDRSSTANIASGSMHQKDGYNTLTFK
ncbi:MAG: carbohydrate-binding family 9-like protein [Candidatus Hydrogenedentes bacterium]|nr:carbohydrate-binding family 9-like protein [Candidatus Hydrogenedentota bacterium]